MQRNRGEEKKSTGREERRRDDNLVPGGLVIARCFLSMLCVRVCCLVNHRMRQISPVITDTRSKRRRGVMLATQNNKHYSLFNVASHHWFSLTYAEQSTWKVLLLTKKCWSFLIQMTKHDNSEHRCSFMLGSGWSGRNCWDFSF